VIGDELAREANLKPGDSLAMLNANGRRAFFPVSGVVSVPPLDMYGVWPDRLVFVPWQHGPLGGDSLLVDGKRSDIEAVLSKVDPQLNPYIQDFAFRIRENSVVWLGVLGIVWCAGALALSLALAGVIAWLTQVFAEHGLEVALRCAAGCGPGGIWLWAARRIRRPVLLGSVVAVTTGAALLLIPSRLLPSRMGWLAIPLLWAVWSLVLWVGGARAAACSPAAKLRAL
jgi:hypothetical protein